MLRISNTHVARRSLVRSILHKVARDSWPDAVCGEKLVCAMPCVSESWSCHLQSRSLSLFPMLIRALSQDSDTRPPPSVPGDWQFLKAAMSSPKRHGDKRLLAKFGTTPNLMPNTCLALVYP